MEMTIGRLIVKSRRLTGIVPILFSFWSISGLLWYKNFLRKKIQIRVQDERIRTTNVTTETIVMQSQKLVNVGVF